MYAKQSKRSRSTSRGRSLTRNKRAKIARYGKSSSRVRSTSTKRGSRPRSKQGYAAPMKELVTNLNDLHSGVTQNAIKCIVNSRPVKGAKGGNICYSQSYKQNLQTVSGVQNSFSFGIGSIRQWLAPTPSYDYGTYGTFTGFFDLNPNQELSGSALYAAATVPLDDRFAMIRTEVQMCIGNMSNMSSMVDIYVLRCKRDTPNTPETDWQVGYTADALGLNPVAITVVTGSGTTNSGGSGSDTYIGSKPTDVKNFNQFWKVLKVHHLNLAAGANERVKFDIVHNYLAQKDNLSTLRGTGGTNSIQYPKGATALLIVQSGQVGSVTGNGYPTIGPSDVNYICFDKHHFKPVYGNAARLSNKYMVQNVAYDATNSDFKFINVVDASANPILD
nr:MAG: capsid protein [Cressdnaviricota sp.]